VTEEQFKYSKELIKDIKEVFWCNATKEDKAVRTAAETGDPFLPMYIEAYHTSGNIRELNDLYGRALNEHDAWQAKNPLPKQPKVQNKYFDGELTL